MCESKQNRVNASCSIRSVRPGDKIRIVTKWTRYEPYEVGDILHVDSVERDGVRGYGLVANEATFIHNNEFEVI
jgi:hypothetical protein